MTTQEVVGWKTIKTNIKQDYVPPMVNSMMQMVVISLMGNVLYWIYPSHLTLSLDAFSLLLLALAAMIWFCRLPFFIFFGKRKEKVVSIIEEDEEPRKVNYPLWLKNSVIYLMSSFQAKDLETVEKLLRITYDGLGTFLADVIENFYEGVLNGGRYGISFSVALLFMQSSGVDVKGVIYANFTQFLGAMVALSLVSILFFFYETVFYQEDETQEVIGMLADEGHSVAIHAPELAYFQRYISNVSSATYISASLTSMFLFATYFFVPPDIVYTHIEILSFGFGIIIAGCVVSFITSILSRIDMTYEVNFVSVEWRINWAILLMALSSLSLIILLSAIIPAPLFEGINISVIMPLLGILILFHLAFPAIGITEDN